jgi:hypothetical protein
MISSLQMDFVQPGCRLRSLCRNGLLMEHPIFRYLHRPEKSGPYSRWGKASSRLKTLRRRHYFEMKGPMLVGFMAVSDERLDNIELNVGMVGGVSFAEDVQKTWHKWFGFQRPNGWDNQLKNEPGFLLNYKRKWRMRTPHKYFGVDADFTPHAGVGLGNILTQASVGFTVRFGGNLRKHDD